MKRVFFSVLLVASIAHADQFTVTDLGTIGGSNAQGIAVNENGQAVANSRTTGNAGWQPFLWDDGARTTGALLPDGGVTYAFGMNDFGFMVGRQDPGGPTGLAVRWAPDGSVTELSGFAGDGFGQAFDINNAGIAVGATGPDVSSQAAVYWTGTTPTALPSLLSGGGGAAWAITEDGWIGGWSENTTTFGDAVIWKPDGTTLNVALSGWIFSNVDAINASKQAVGSGFLGNGAVPFLWENGTTTLLSLPTGYAGLANDINDLGIAVGGMGAGPTVEDAVYWDANGVRHSLNSAELAAQGWELHVATGINNDGWIVGIGELDGVQRAFLLKPVPEPGTLILLAGALAGCWAIRRRRAN